MFYILGVRDKIGADACAVRPKYHNGVDVSQTRNAMGRPRSITYLFAVLHRPYARYTSFHYTLCFRLKRSSLEPSKLACEFFCRLYSYFTVRCGVCLRVRLFMRSPEGYRIRRECRGIKSQMSRVRSLARAQTPSALLAGAVPARPLRWCRSSRCEVLVDDSLGATAAGARRPPPRARRRPAPRRLRRRPPPRNKYLYKGGGEAEQGRAATAGTR
ncbi:hypothetical protein EVAR_96801_1 [Eumeta japonica]|uniref:Uncharacterized protein n=1 Tax=Eumeta variegata TaxID=151549 RepID=A0A4C1WAY7_EUMVA|nr:hypothetical protein EVAR_96801_1 [Eumeta japonica]